MFLTAKGMFMKMETRYHATRDDIAAEEAEINAAKRDPRAFGPLYERYYAPTRKTMLTTLRSKLLLPRLKTSANTNSPVCPTLRFCLELR
jgi:hypothetical protein